MGGGGEGEGGGIEFCAVATAMSNIEHASMANNGLTMPKRRRVTRPTTGCVWRVISTGQVSLILRRRGSRPEHAVSRSKI
eukprot:1614849-Prymnesium_polylepis.1